MAHSSMAERARKQAEERKNKGKGGTTIQLPDNVDKLEVEKGTMHLDIVPYEVSVSNHREGVKKGDLWYERTYGVHFNIGVEERAMICPKLTLGKPCPICEEHAKMRKDPDADEEAVKALRPKERQLFNVVDLDSKKQAVQILDMSWWLFGKVVEEEVREGSKDAAGFADLEGGKTLVVRFSSASLGGNAYLEATRVDFKDRDDYPEKILDEVVDLDTVLVVPTYEELEKALKGADDEPDEKDEGKGRRRGKEEDDEPKRRRSSEEDEPKGKEEEEPPRRRRDAEDDEPKRKPRDEQEEPKRRSRDEEEEPRKRRGEEEEPKRRSRDEDESESKGKKDEWDDWGPDDKGKKKDEDDEPRSRKSKDEDDDKPKEDDEPRRRRRE